MLQIRRQQERQLADALLEQAALDRLRRFFPDDCERLGPELQPWIRRSVQRARGHGFASQGDALGFILASMALGEGFDAEFAWAGGILNPADPAQRPFRARRLYEAALTHLRATERQAGGEGRR
jgi:hypothetical protein